MYRTLIAAKSPKLLFEIKALDIWNDKTEFEFTTVCRDIQTAAQAVTKDRYDLVITEVFKNGFEKFISALKKNGCPNIIALSVELTLENARLCIKNSVSDYFVPPFEKDEFTVSIEEIKTGAKNRRSDISAYASELGVLFNTHNADFLKRAGEIFKLICGDTVIADKSAEELLKSFAENIFDKNEWLDLYINKEDVYTNSGNIDIADFFETALADFYDKWLELYPTVQNDKILNVILYILNNPESDLKQKSIAASLHINSSYLSTVFTAHTAQRFVDYLTNVKLRRAAWLLRNTTLKVNDIAEKLDYRDIGYFSRIFKKKYGVTPSEYRIPDNYNYYI